MGIISYPQHHKLPATSLFTQQLVQANNKENIKPLPLWGGCGVWSPEYFPHKGPIIQSFRIMAPTCYYIFTKEWICLKKVLICKTPLRWSHNDPDGVSNHQPHHCLLNCLFGRRSKKTSKLRVTCLCAGNHRAPVNSPHKWPVTRKMFPFDDVIMHYRIFKSKSLLKFSLSHMQTSLCHPIFFWPVWKC